MLLKDMSVMAVEMHHPSLTRRRSTVWFDGSRRLAWAKSCQVEALQLRKRDDNGLHDKFMSVVGFNHVLFQSVSLMAKSWS